MRLFCFACAGGTASFFDQMKPYLTPSIKMTCLEYAGHGARWKEAFYQDFQGLVDDLYTHIREKMKTCQEAGINDQKMSIRYKETERNILPPVKSQEPYALLGYSMGSIAAVEVLRKILVDGGLLPPVHVFLAAHEPHSKIEMQGFSSCEIDAMVKERTIRFGGIPDTLINNHSFWRMYLPVYRADYSMISRYDFKDLVLQTQIPATVFYSENDTPLVGMERWKRYFTEKCDFIRFEGNHFFIQQHYQEMAGIISERLLLT